ncbi:MAG: hypothetical protein ACTTJK_09795 [Phocaeicola sp.]
MHSDSIGSAFAPFLCFFFVFLRQYAVILFSGFFCFFIQFVFFVSRYVSYEAVSYLGEYIYVFLFFFYFLFVKDFRECVKCIFCIMAYFFIYSSFCGGDDAVCYGGVGGASCLS